MTDEFTTNKAMILARGLGTRMQKQADGVRLDTATADLAAKGAKGLISIGEGRPFLDYSLQVLMDAGIRDFCLVVAPGTSMLRSYYEAVGESLTNGRISFAVQDEPLGTADAVSSGRKWAEGNPFIVVNCDNFYTPAAVLALISSPAPATVAFEREALIANSNIPAERIRRFAVIDFDQSGHLRRIVEKPDRPDDYAHDGKLYVSMNCFLFTADIFEACNAIEPNPIRKEYELPTAVQYTIEQMGLTYQAVKCTEGVLDMTGRDDIESIRRILADHEVRFDAPAKSENV
ncbi:MAG: nucleotidyltransferase family protein [Planctomycetota bacterium]|nr:nucleotidyltransferase family protein [Planctomycetota bacterium]